MADGDRRPNLIRPVWFSCVSQEQVITKVVSGVPQLGSCGDRTGAFFARSAALGRIGFPTSHKLAIQQREVGARNLCSRGLRTPFDSGEVPIQPWS